ncbi:oxidation resistance protein 1 [Camelus ferus]|nr:oxidation resistance protein 1 [Camelus ferus]
MHPATKRLREVKTKTGFNPLAGAGKQMPQASKPPAPKTPIIEEEQNNTANSQKHPSRRSELKRFYTIGEYRVSCKCADEVCLNSTVNVWGCN